MANPNFIAIGAALETLGVQVPLLTNTMGNLDQLLQNLINTQTIHGQLLGQLAQAQLAQDQNQLQTDIANLQTESANHQVNMAACHATYGFFLLHEHDLNSHCVQFGSFSDVLEQCFNFPLSPVLVPAWGDN